MGTIPLVQPLAAVRCRDPVLNPRRPVASGRSCAVPASQSLRVPIHCLSGISAGRSVLPRLRRTRCARDGLQRHSRPVSPRMSPEAERAGRRAQRPPPEPRAGGEMPRSTRFLIPGHPWQKAEGTGHAAHCGRFTGTIPLLRGDGAAAMMRLALRGCFTGPADKMRRWNPPRGDTVAGRP